MSAVPSETFGQLCMKAMQVAKLSAKAQEVAFTTDDCARIIDRLDADRTWYDRPGAPVPAAPKKPRKPRAPKLSGARNPLFDALALATGCQDLTQITRSMARTIGVALADIREVMPNVSPEEITSRAAAYRSKHREWELTAPSLAKHWSEFGGGERTRRAKLDPYLEPQNWRSTAETLWGAGVAQNLSSVPWSEVSIALRADIVRASA